MLRTGSCTAGARPRHPRCLRTPARLWNGLLSERINPTLTLLSQSQQAHVTPSLPQSSLPPKERSQLPNLVRWYDHIHFTADPACYYPDLEISKPVFASPRPSAPTPAPAAAAGTAGNKEGAKAAPEPKAAARTQATGPEGQQPRAKKEKKAKEAKEAQVAAAPAAPAPAEEPLVDLLDLR